MACVIKVDRESMRVLDQNSQIRSILPSQVTNKIEPRRNAVATDRNGSEIRVGDVVREVSGESRSGTILHIHRSFLFVHNRTQIENSGLFTTRCVNVATLAAKGGRITSSGPDLTKMNPALQMKNGVNGNGAMAPPKTFGRDRTLGKTVTIRKGPYKGMLGIVKDTTDTSARVELHSKSKVVNIEKSALSVKEYVHYLLSSRVYANLCIAPSRASPWTFAALTVGLEHPREQTRQVSVVPHLRGFPQTGQVDVHLWLVEMVVALLLGEPLHALLRGPDLLAPA